MGTRLYNASVYRLPQYLNMYLTSLCCRRQTRTEVMGWTLMSLEQHLGRFLGRGKMTSRYYKLLLWLCWWYEICCRAVKCSCRIWTSDKQILIVGKYAISTFDIIWFFAFFFQMAIMFMKIDTNCDGTVDWVSLYLLSSDDINHVIQH